MQDNTTKDPVSQDEQIDPKSKVSQGLTFNFEKFSYESIRT